MKKVSILGSTGSIGRNTVDLLLSQPEKFSVQALTANRNAGLLADQAIKLKAKKAVVVDPSVYAELRDRLAGTGIEAASGEEAVCEAAAMPADWIMAAIVGMAGLRPVMAAIAQGTCVAIANKEPLVAAGPFVMEAARVAGTTLLPVDSEHNAVFQVFDPKQASSIERIILTASGGPFRTWTPEKIKTATPAQAVAHPNWSMGAKISVDSATMMNKALEIIEAHWLFGLPPEKIEVLIHPQSIVHSMVEYRDGSVLAQMGAPDMRTPIAHALAWPERMATTGQRLDLLQAPPLEFRPPDLEKFPALPLAYKCLAEGLGACVTLNAANEAAVAAFLEEKISFPEIIMIINEMLQNRERPVISGIEDVILCDKLMRERAQSLIMNSQQNLKRRSGGI